MKAACLFLALCLFASAGVDGRALLQGSIGDSLGLGTFDPGTVTSVETSSSSTGGEASVTASAETDATTDFTNDIAEMTETVLVEVQGGADVVAVVNERESAIGLAIAEAFAQTIVSVRTTGEGQACGSAFGSASAAAYAFASAFFEGIAIAVNDLAESSVSDQIAALSSVSVDAFAEARSEACAGDDSSAEVISTATASALAEPFADAMVEAIAAVENGNTDGNSTTTAVEDFDPDLQNESNTDITTDGSDATADGDTDTLTSAGFADICAGVFADCCERVGGEFAPVCECGTPSLDCQAELISPTLAGAVYNLTTYSDTDFSLGYNCRCTI